MKKKILIFIITYKASYRLLDVYNDIPFKMARAMSAPFVVNAEYGTRSSILIMIDKNLKVNFIEDVYNPKNHTFKKLKYYDRRGHFS